MKARHNMVMATAKGGLTPFPGRSARAKIVGVKNRKSSEGRVKSKFALTSRDLVSLDQFGLARVNPCHSE